MKGSGLRAGPRLPLSSMFIPSKSRCVNGHILLTQLSKRLLHKKGQKKETVTDDLLGREAFLNSGSSFGDKNGKRQER